MQSIGHVPQVAGWVGIVDRQVLIVRTYADGAMTAELKGVDSREVPLVSELVQP